MAYATDEKAAQQRFGNKPLIVEGMVWAHSQKNDFLTYVVLYGHPRKTYVADEQYLWLICLLDKAHQDEISTLKVGDTVRLFGQSHGLVPSQGIRAYFSAQHLSRKQ